MPNKKKSRCGQPIPVEATLPGFDYDSLIPANLKGEERALVKRFLTNRMRHDDEREGALALFAAALVEDKKEEEEERKAASGDSSQAGGSSSANGETNADTTVSGATAAATSAASAAGRAQAHAAVVTAPSTSTKPLNQKQPYKPVKDTQKEHVQTEIANEVRKNVNVGWWATPADADETTDYRIAEYAQSLGAELYNFISYPIGGMARSTFQLQGPTVPIPPLDLPDLQLANPYWETYVAGHPSSWIDCDSEDEWTREQSRIELQKELAYAHYLGLNTVVLELRHKETKELGKVLSHFLWTQQSTMKICLMLPTSIDALQGENERRREVWEIWADLCREMGYYTSDRFQCGIRIMENLDDEFASTEALQRWLAEPVAMFSLETSVFTTNTRTGGADLAPAHTALLETLWTSETMTATIRGPPTAQSHGARLQYAQAIRSIIGPLWLKKKLSKKPNFLDLNDVQYQDVIQKPLQPLADNLQSGVYNTFEADSPKYTQYGKATELAIVDMVKKRGTGDVVLYVLGAGRGPLMSAAMAAEKRINDRTGNAGMRVRMELVAVEKNVNAIVTLNYLNKTVWNGRVRIVQADMRQLKEVAMDLGLRRPDIAVSELLGSFGDNELSPECIYGCADWMKEDTIMIPQKYTSYAEPICSSSLFHSIRAQPTNYYLKGRRSNGRFECEPASDGSWRLCEEGTLDEDLLTDMLYVVYLDKVVRPMQPKPFFTFDHPDTQPEITQKKFHDEGQIWEGFEWAMDIMGFACYFEAQLYKDVTLSIVRGEETKDMLSWFPAVLPLRTMLRVLPGSKLRLRVGRSKDEGGVWYSWEADVDWESDDEEEVQNEEGDCYYMRLDMTKREKDEWKRLEDYTAYWAKRADEEEDDEDEEEDEEESDESKEGTEDDQKKEEGEKKEDGEKKEEGEKKTEGEKKE